MLKSQIDEDDFCKKLRISQNESLNTNFYAYFYCLLINPSSSTLENFLSNFMMQDIVNGLKHLIKFKFDRITDEVKKNILSIIEMLLNYEGNIDTLIVNLLRHQLIDEVYHMYQEKKRYFEEHSNCLMFLTFLCQDIEIRKKISFVRFDTRDFLFISVKEAWERFYNNKKISTKYIQEEKQLLLSPFPLGLSDKQYLKSLLVPTPLNILSSQLSVELEMNLIFILENDNNFNFHISILFDNYIKNANKACWVIRYLVNIHRPLDISRLVNAIIKKYPTSFIALIYDFLFWNQTEQLNKNLIEYLKKEDNDIVKKVFSFKQDWGLLELALDNINKKQECTIEDVVKIIHNLNFSKYYELIVEMEKWKIIVIPREMYNKIIIESFGWDGYAQVYLWKIIGFQKIHFGFEVNEFKGGSLEALEGFEIVKNLRFTTNKN